MFVVVPFRAVVVVGAFIAVSVLSNALPTWLYLRNSFVGHLAGIFAGYWISFGLFEWVSSYWLYTSLVRTRARHAVACQRSSPTRCRTTVVWVLLS